MARPKNKENDILTAAVEVFMEKGFSETSIQDIANHAGIGKGTVYDYFKSKDELFVQAIKYDASKIFVQVVEKIPQKIPQNELFLNKLMNFIELMQDAFLQNFRRIEYFMTRNISSLNPQAQLDFKNNMFELKYQVTILISNMLKQGIEEGEIQDIDIEFAADMIHGMILFTCERACFKNHSKEQRKEENEKLINIIMMGIGTK